MPRWAEIVLTLVLFAALMLATRYVLEWAIPYVLAASDSILSKVGTTILMAALVIVGGIYGFWPRDRMGQMRPLKMRRRRRPEEM